MATYTLISSNVLASNASSITFSAIPATYTDLVIKFTARSTSADTDPTNTARLRIDLNGDSSTGSITSLLGNGATTSSFRDAGTNYVLGLQGTNTTSNTFTNGEIYVPSYTASQSKPFSVLAVTETNATTALTSAGANLWANSSAITSVTLQALFGSIVAGSSFHLYGIKNS